MSVDIAHREIVSAGGRGRVSIYKPEPNQLDWRCEYELEWPGVSHRHYAMGIDSFQALQLAMLAAIMDVAASGDFKSGKLTGWGEPLTTIDELKQFFGVSRLPGYDA